MKIILSLLLSFFFTLQAFAFSSPELAKLWDIPTETILTETTKKYSYGNVNVEEIYYLSRQYKGEPSKIFGYYCYPKNQKGKLPAVLIVHGGGGSAKLNSTAKWAQNGYAALSIDLPGKGQQRWRSRSTGPDMVVPNLLRTKPDLTDNYLVHAVAAARNGITYLSKRPEVDSERIGQLGLSWGGVITLLTNGQDKRLKTAINVFGSGYIYEGSTWQRRFDAKTKAELLAWNTFIDPNSFLSTQHAPILFITGSNDHCYYLPTFQKSYSKVRVEKDLLIIPNLKHKFPAYLNSIALTWMDSKLKNTAAFPKIYHLPVHTKGTEKVILPVMATPFKDIEKVTLYYAHGGSNGWTIKKWEKLEAYYEDGVHYFAIPTKLVKPEIVFFVNAKDKRGAAVSTPVRSLFRIVMPENENTFALTAPLKQIGLHEGPIQFFGSTPTPDFSRIYFSEQSNAYKLLSFN